MLNENHLKRLALIKYYFGIAIEQAKRSEPFCAYSILTFHDSVELFLQLACECLDISKSDVKFLAYWDLISPEIKDGLTQKESMRRLNSARKELKHNGTLPSRFAIDDFKFNSRNFFIENTKRIFGIEFEDISLIDLIQSQRVKDILKEAIKLTNENNQKEALIQIGGAFHILFWEHERANRFKYGTAPHFLGRTIGRGITTPDISIRHSHEDMFRFFDEVKESLISIQDEIKILSLGIDYRKYAKFKLFVPIVMSWSSDGEYVIETKEIMKSDKLDVTKEDIQFCIDFIIECATIAGI